MNDLEIKYAALRAERSAVKLDVSMTALYSEIERLEKKSEEKDGDDIYSAMFLDGIHGIIQEVIEELFQIKHDLLQKQKNKDL